MKLPIISAKELISFLKSKGFVEISQKGSHLKMKKFINEQILVTIIPMKPEIKLGTLISILKQTKLTREELIDYFK